MTLKSPYSLKETVKYGTGRFGAKTEGLLELGPFMGKHIFVPNHLSLPIDFFFPALVKNRILSDDGRLLKRFAKFESGQILDLDANFYPAMQFTPQELAILREIFEIIKGIPLAFRSDERTAKGIGAFSSESCSFRDFDRFLNLFSKVIYHQFTPVPLAFSERVGLELGIGLQFMPIQGILTEDGMLIPPLSLTGFTDVAHNEIHAVAAFGANAETVGSTLRVSNDNIEQSCRLKSDLMDFKVTFFNAHGFRKVSSVRTLRSQGNFWDPNSLQEKILALNPHLIEAAKRAGTDIYFELKMTDFSENIWAAVQLARHKWAGIAVPNDVCGKVRYLLYSHAPRSVAGSGTFVADGLVSFGSGDLKAAYLGDEVDSERFRGKIAVGSLDAILARIVDFFELFSKAVAVIDTSSDHISDISSHGGGIFREAGIPLINAPEWINQGLRLGLYFPSNYKSFTLYANELTGEAAIRAERHPDPPGEHSLMDF